LNTTSAVASDAAGNLYVAARYESRVYMISTSGTIATIAGNGVVGFSGDGDSATAPYGVAVNSAGSVIYIADSGNNRIRKVTGGVITTVAGTGSPSFSGDGGLATSAALNNPSSISLDSSGNVYFSDTFNYRIREVALNGIINTVAGNGTCCFSGDGGPATSAQLNNSTAVAVAGSSLYIADTENFRVREVSSGIITTVAGNGLSGYSGDNGPATSAQLSSAYGIAVDGSGNLFISDSYNSSIRKVSGGVITTVAGTGACGFSDDSGAATSAALCYPYDVALDGSGNLYIADTNNYRVRKVASGIITTLAGTGYASFSGDGGQATEAQLNSPSSLAVDGSGNLYIADSGNCRIREVSSGGVITTVAGTGVCGYSGDGGPPTAAQISSPAIAADSSGDLYLAEAANDRVRKVSGVVIHTIAGNGVPGFSGDGGPGTSAMLNTPNAVAVDSVGNVYISDSANARIRVLTPGATPAITSTAPTSVIAGTASFTLTVDGSNLASGNVVEWNGIVLSTSFLSGQLFATASSSLISQPGTAYITVNGISNPVAFTVLPQPSVTSLTPSSVSAGQTVNLTITGSNFLTSSVPYWNNAANTGNLPNAGFVDSSHLTATVPGSYISGGGGFNVAVSTPNVLGPILSNSLTISVIACGYILGNNSSTIPSAAYSNSVALTANCPYAATSNNPSFITITSGASGSGSGTIGYSVAANNTGAQRVGSFTVTDQNGFSAAVFTVTQQAPPCVSLTASPSSFSFGSGTASSSIALSASCPWNNASSSDTTVVTLPASSGSSISIPFNVSANPGSSSRGAAITFYQPEQ
jgi:sugar lactone lactonase YvrE